MSEAPLPVFACGTCHHLLSIKICKSDKNGNAGRSFTCCYKRHNNGTNCSLFAWVDARLSPPSLCFASSSPPSSPALSNLSSTPFSSTSGVCAKSGKSRCKLSRIHPDCNRRMCRQHCIEGGGCRAKGHGTTDKGKQHATSPFSQHSPSSSPPQEISTTSASTAVDMFADPRHASQMTAVFAKHYVLQQTLEEQRRAADAERIANVEKAKHHVIVYAWPQVCLPFRYAFSFV
jgi:hypothetical protein